MFPPGRIPVRLGLCTGSKNLSPRAKSFSPGCHVALGLLTYMVADVPSWLNFMYVFIFNLVDLVTGCL